MSQRASLVAIARRLRLPSAEREPLFAACDRALAAMADTIGASVAIGVGRFAEGRVERILGGTRACRGVPHPSPANAHSGHAFAREMDRLLSRLGCAA